MSEDSVPKYEHPMDLEKFRKHGYEMIDYIVDYYKTIEKRPPLSQIQPGDLLKQLPKEAPNKPESFKQIMEDVEKLIQPGITHWQSPNFYAYFSSNSSGPSQLAEMLSSAVNVIGFSWTASPACTELEIRMMDWLAKILKLPSFYLSTSNQGGGVIQGTASEATLVALIAARQKIKRKLKKSGSELLPRLVAYTSDQAHSSVKKATMILDIPHVRLIGHEKDTFKMDCNELEKQIQKDLDDGLLPFFVLGTVGTTSSLAVDDLTKIGPIAQKYDLWMHIDAAFLGSACVCPEYRHWLNGVEYSTSFNFNPHKHMMVNFDCSAMWIKDKESLVDAMSITPEYLRNKFSDLGSVVDYKDWQIPLGRKFRSLKLWFVLRSYGVEKLQNYYRHHVELCKHVESWMEKEDRFRIWPERVADLLCFRLKGQSNEVQKKYLEKLNKSGKLFMIGTKLDDLYVLRMSTTGIRLELDHLKGSWKVMLEVLDELVEEDELKFE